MIKIEKIDTEQPQQSIFSTFMDPRNTNEDPLFGKYFDNFRLSSTSLRQI